MTAITVASTFELGVERYRAGACAEAETIFARLRDAQERAQVTDPRTAQATADLLVF
jgi:hypothetical protein